MCDKREKKKKKSWRASRVLNVGWNNEQNKSMYCLNVIVTSFPADDTRIDSAAALLKPFNEKKQWKDGPWWKLGVPLQCQTGNWWRSDNGKRVVVVLRWEKPKNKKQKKKKKKKKPKKLRKWWKTTQYQRKKRVVTRRLQIKHSQVYKSNWPYFGFRDIVMRVEKKKNNQKTIKLWKRMLKGTIIFNRGVQG